MMNEIATVAATEYCLHYEATGGANQARIKQSPGHNTLRLAARPLRTLAILGRFFGEHSERRHDGYSPDRVLSPAELGARSNPWVRPLARSPRIPLARAWEVMILLREPNARKDSERLK